MADPALGINGRLEEGETLQAWVLGSAASLQWQALVNGSWSNVGAANSQAFVIPAGAAGTMYRLAASSAAGTSYSTATPAATLDTKKANAPVLGGSSPGSIATENAGPVTPFNWLAFSDADRAGYGGGSLLLQDSNSTLYGGDGHDLLSVRFAGTGAGQFSYNAATREIRYAFTSGTATAIGTIDAALNGNGTDLKIVFNANATTAVVDALIDNLQFSNNDDSPVPGRLLTLRVTDPSGASAQRVTSMTIQPQADAPVITSAAAFIVDENQLAAGAVAATDPDRETGAPQGIGYSLAAGQGGGDNALFEIDAATGALRFKAAPDFENPAHGPQYSVRVRATGSGGGTAEQVVSVAVRNVNDAPVAVAPGAGTVAESGTAQAGTLAATGQLLATDADAGDVLGWSGGQAAGSYGNFAIASDGRWTYTLDDGRPATNALAQGQSVTETFVATVHDAAGATAQTQVTITVQGANDGPTVGPAGAGATVHEAALGGRLRLDLGGNEGDAVVRVDAAGRVAVLGFTQDPQSGMAGPVLARYLADGTVDAAFGDGGRSGFAGTFNPKGLAIDTADGLVCVGYSWDAYGQNRTDWSIQRFDASGQLDTAFGAGGRVLIDFGQSYDYAESVTALADGSLLVIGTTPDASGMASRAAVRLLADGSRDMGFGTGGVLRFADGPMGSKVAVDAQGRLLAWGVTEDAGGAVHFTVSRYLANGALDLGFGDGGHASIPAGVVQDAGTLAVAADGRIVLGWSEYAGQWNNHPLRLAMLHADGTLDTAFGAGGVAAVPFNIDSLQLAFDLQGGLLAAFSGPNGDLQLARFLGDGSLDAGFHGGTPVAVDFGGNEQVGGIQLRADGSIVIAGQSWLASAQDMVLASVTANGSLDSHFGDPVAAAVSASGQLGATDPDAGDVLHWSGSADGTYGQFLLADAGSWTYLLDSARAATQALAEGQVATEHFTATVTDGHGGSASTVVEITVVGSYDVPQV
ncbi:MAG: VCBS domain-containing protein [Pseudomonadota bacterium]